MARIARRWAALAWLVAAAAWAAPDPALPSAPVMRFTPNPAGTYTLQRIQACPDGDLLDAAGRARTLSGLTTGKITLLTFFYTYCTDRLGCPFAFALMRQLRDRLAADPDLQRHVRFVDISLDPVHDSPEQLRRFAHGLSQSTPFEWDFLTAPSPQRLRPLLESFGQDLGFRAPSGGSGARVNHMLKLFLIDSTAQVREIYALDYLQPEVMLNDIRTLRLESRAAPRR